MYDSNRLLTAYCFIGLTSLCVGACTDETVNQALIREVAFSEIAIEVGRVQLEEPDTAVITDIRRIAISDSGDLLMVDLIQNQLRRYDASDGRLVRAVGRRGGGPGEFHRPTSVVQLPNEGIYVSDINNHRVARYTSDLTLDTTFRFDDSGARAVIGMPDNTLLIKTGRRDWEYAFERHTPEMERLNGVHPHHPAITVPYWNSMWDEHVTAGAEHLYVASNMIYPIYRYTWRGEIVDSFGTAPPSWNQASRPKRGEFLGPVALSAVQRWFRSFTTISHLGLYQDTLLLVTHEAFNPDELSYFESSFRMDIYTDKGVKIVEDVELPGRVLFVNDLIYLVVEQPPEGWTIGMYRLRRDIGGKQ